MPGTPLATAFVRVRPSPGTRAAFQAETDAAVGPAAAASGEKAATTFGSRLTGGLAKLTPKIAKWGTVAFAGAIVGSLDAGSKLEDSQALLGKAIDKTGGKWKDYAAPVTAAQKKLADFGFSSAQTNQALAKLVTATGSTKTALGLLGNAADLAAFKHEDLNSAVTALAGAASGNQRALKGLNITVATGATQATALAAGYKILNDQVQSAGGVAQFAAQHHLTEEKALDLLNAATGSVAFSQTELAKRGLTLASAQTLVSNAMAGNGTAIKDLAKHHLTLAQAQAYVQKASEGDVSAFNKLGVEVLPKTATAAQRLAQTQSLLNSRIGGQAATAADTTAGKMAALRAKFTDLTASLGEKLMPLFTKLLTFLTGPLGIPVLIGIATIAFISWTASIAASAAGLLGFESAGAAFTAGMDAIKGACIGTRLELLALRAQALASAAWGAIAAGASKAWAGAQWLLNAALDANPIGIVVVAVAALVAGLIIAYKTSGTFRRIVKEAFGDVLHAAEDAWHWIRSNWPLLLGILTGPVGVAVLLIVRNWSKITDGAKNVLTDVRRLFDGAKNWLVQGGKNIITGLWNGIKSVFDGVTKWFKDIPGKILGWLGIASPPKWAIDAGRHIMSGISIGMHGGLRGVGAVASAVGGAVSGGVARWKPDVLEALSMLGLPASLAPRVLYQMQTESGGNQGAINLTDINAQQGDPSRGLMQVIMTTFEAFRSRMLPNDIYNPLANIYAALNYARNRYGPTLMSGGMGVGSGHGYALGGRITEPIFGIGRSGKAYSFGEGGKGETVIPDGAGGGTLEYIAALLEQLLGVTAAAPSRTSAGLAGALSSASRGAGYSAIYPSGG